MGSEIELKIVGINPNNAKKRLAAINARFKGSYVLQRVTFQGTRSGRIKDYKSNTANDSYYTSWIRVRTDGKRTTLTLKEQRGTGITKRSEYEVEVSDFATTVKILTKMIPDAYRNYMITTRDVYELGDVTITIDKWPYLPYQLEIEGSTEKKIREVYDRLKISGKIAPSIAISDEEYYKLHNIDYKKLVSDYNARLNRLLGRVK